MPKLPLPIISETCLEKCGWIWDNLNSKLHLGHLTFNTFEKYGVKGINVGKLVPGKILMFSSTNISNMGVVNRSVTNAFPKALHIAAYQDMANENRSAQENAFYDASAAAAYGEYENKERSALYNTYVLSAAALIGIDYDDHQVLPHIFQWFDNVKGPFIWNVCTTEENRITEKFLAGNILDLDLAGRSLVINLPMGVKNNELCKQALIKLNEDFNKNVNDFKALLFIKLDRNAGYFPLLCNYECLQIIPANTVFSSIPWREHFKVENTQMVETYFGRQRVLLQEGVRFPIGVYYRDKMTPVQMNPFYLAHLRLNHFSNVYIRDLYEKGVNLGIPSHIFELYKNVPVEYWCESCRQRQRVLQVKESTSITAFCHHLHMLLSMALGL
jgi:hypothetical protein